VFILNASVAAEVPRESGRGLEIKTNQHFCFSLSPEEEKRKRGENTTTMV
jgi:hypothetical protein